MTTDSHASGFKRRKPLTDPVQIAAIRFRQWRQAEKAVDREYERLRAALLLIPKERLPEYLKETEAYE
jgi:hypothetical protein